ncbi:hypothetical protein YC2023_041617 [Brassica napus]
MPTATAISLSKNLIHLGVGDSRLYKKATLIAATVNVHHLAIFRQRLKVGSLFSISRFEVTLYNQSFMLTDSPVMIRFSGSTTFEELTETQKGTTSIIRDHEMDSVFSI